MSKMVTTAELNSILMAYPSLVNWQAALALERFDTDRALNFQRVSAQKLLWTIRNRYGESADVLGELEASLVTAGDADILWGLDNFVSRLTGMAGLPVALCYFSADSKAAIVALNPERESVLAIVCVTY